MAVSTIKKELITKTVTVTTGNDGVFNPISAVGGIAVCILAVVATEGWYHFRFYSGSGSTTRVIVTSYNDDTPIKNTTLIVRITYLS